MSPRIGPILEINQPSYTIDDSTSFYATLELDFGDVLSSSNVRTFTVTYLGTPANLSIRLIHLPTQTTVELTTLAGIDSTVPHREISVSRAPGTVIGVIENTENNGILDEGWQVRASSTDRVNWTFAVDDTQTSEVTRLLCDPVARFATPPPGTVLEDDDFSVMAALATDGTWVGPPDSLPPVVTYRFAHSAPIAIMALPQLGQSQTCNVDPPGVYRSIDVPITLTVGFDIAETPEPDPDPDPTRPDLNFKLDNAFLRNSVLAPAVTIGPRPQQVALVLDRSGSMGDDNKWTNAKTAARLFANLFAAFREGVHPDDRIGIVVFEDDATVFHGPPVSPKVAVALQPAKLDNSQSLICGLDLGLPGQNTPIGDGLIAGMQMLLDGGPNDPHQEDPDPDVRFTLFAVTDGKENCGVVKVGPGTPPPGVKTFAAARLEGQLALVNAQMKLYTIGLGSDVDDAVLNNLADNGRFLKIVNPNQLAEGFAQMLTRAQKVAALKTSDEPPSHIPDLDPPATGNAVYFKSATGAEKVAVGVLADSGTIELAVRQGGHFNTNGSITPCNGHILGVADPIPLGTGDLEWRVLLKDDNGNPLPLDEANVLPYEDLHVDADFRLDKQSYLTGDRMRLTVRVRHDAAPILGATVKATLEAPDQGLGETLTGLGPDFKPSGKVADSGGWKGEMVQTVLRDHGWKHWPTNRPTGTFIDHTDELHDENGDGNYTNTFARAFAEGTYTWRILVEGRDAQGNPFDRSLTLSTHVAVKVDARATKVKVTRIANHPSKMLAARVVVTPQDVRGERLGPGFDRAVIWSLDEGTFEHVFLNQPAPVTTDGNYQRVVLFKKGQRPHLKVSVVNVVLPRIDVISW